MGSSLDLSKYSFLFIVLGLFIAGNSFVSIFLVSYVSSEFLRSLITSLLSGLSFLFTFVAVTWHYIPNVASRFWAKFLVLALFLFSFYAVLSLAYGEPLLNAMGFELAPVPVGSTLLPSEYATLSFFTYGFSSITNGLVSVAVAYFLQKYMVRGIFFVFKRLTKYKNFLEVGKRNEPSIFVIVLWLLLLPFPLQNVLSPSPVGVNALGTSLYLISTLALFAMWGLGLARLVGVTKNKIVRLYGFVRDSLFWLIAIQWLSSLVYSSVAPPLFVSSAIKYGLLLVRVLFAFMPPALVTAYLYKHALENRSEQKIAEYLKQKEHIEPAKITVGAEKAVIGD